MEMIGKMKKQYLLKMGGVFDAEGKNPLSDPTGFLIANTLQAFQTFFPIDINLEIDMKNAGKSFGVQGKLGMDTEGIFFEYDLIQ